MDVRQPLHSEHVKTLDTAALRRHFLVERLFLPDELCLIYSQIDRIIVGGAMPVGSRGADFAGRRRRSGLPRRQAAAVVLEALPAPAAQNWPVRSRAQPDAQPASPGAVACAPRGAVPWPLRAG